MAKNNIYIRGIPGYKNLYATKEGEILKHTVDNVNLK